tara:strand:+ start:292 stop:474 length:183 start_codon:yes stop_codon:yes gene_type:complete
MPEFEKIHHITDTRYKELLEDIEEANKHIHRLEHTIRELVKDLQTRDNRIEHLTKKRKEG